MVRIFRCGLFVVAFAVTSMLWAQTPVAALIGTLDQPKVKDTDRWSAAIALGTTSFADATERDAAIQALIKALQSREAGLRVNAATALGRIGDPTAVTALTRAMNDRNSLVRRAAARALGQIGTEDAAKALLDRMTEPNTLVRAQIVQALGDSGQPIAVTALEATLLSQNEPEDRPLREQAARALARLGGYAVDSFIRGTQVNDEEVRRLSATGLGALGDPRGAGALIAILNDWSPRVAGAASSALARLGEPAITPLMNELANRNATIRRHAMTALVGIGPPAVAPLEAAYNAADARLAELEDERAQAQIAEQRAQQGMPATTSPATTTPSAQPQSATAPPIAGADVKREVKQLEKSLRTLNKERQEYEKLVMYRRAQAVFNDRIEAAKRALASPEPLSVPTPELQVAGVAPLAAAPPALTPQPRPALPAIRPTELIEDDITVERRKADTVIMALGGIGNDEAVRVLTDILQNGRLEEATLAADALGRSRNSAAIPTLIAVAPDASYPSSVRANAARGLGRLRAVQAQALLENLATSDPLPNVRQAAQQALDDLIPLIGQLPTGSAQ